MTPPKALPAPMQVALGRARSLARRAADLWPLTPLGMALGVVAAVATVNFGFKQLDLVLLVLGYGGAGLLAISTVIVATSAFGLSVRLRRMPFQWSTSTFETGSALPTGFWLPSLRWLPLVQVKWSWVSPDALAEQVRQSGRLRELVSPQRRGIFPEVVRRVVVQDAFGLSRIAFRHLQSGPIEVLPHLGGIRRLPVLTSLTGGEEYPHPMGLEAGDRVELRRYVPGDSARFIHWKVFGRTRKLMVRVPERAWSRARRTVAYLVTGAHDEAAAAAARAAIEEEALGLEWQFAADGSPEATSDRSEALHKIMQSAGFEGPSGSGMKRFLAEVDRQGPAALVVFAPPTAGPWLDEMRSLTMRRYGRVRVVIAVDAVHDSNAEPRWRRWLLEPLGSAGVGRGDLQRVGRALGQLRCEVVVIDRVSGRVMGDGMHLDSIRGRAA
ncbi:MAG: DUF58 domain-containing protein [Myxococcales bacterium]|nr:DUF58 domain-containing protein [Myxococcales bacterium]